MHSLSGKSWGIPADILHFPTNLAYLSGLLYGLVLSMMFTLIPLYLLDLGYGAAEVGIVISTQGVLQVLLQFGGGVISDRFGERIVLGFSFVAIGLSVVLILISPAFVLLLIAQLLIGASRSVYWIAGQSYVSRSIEGKSGVVLGRLLSFESSGIALGGVLAGIQAATLGYSLSFLTCGILCGLGALAVLILPELSRSQMASSLRDSMAPVPSLLRSRPILMAAVVAVAASISAALVTTIYPVYYTEVGFGEAFIGTLRSLNSIGVVAVAFGFGVIMNFIPPRFLIFSTIILTGVFTACTTIAGGTVWSAALVILVTGCSFGVLRALYPAMTAMSSKPEERGVALSVVALYWSLGQLLVPVIFGFIAEYYGVASALWTASFVLLGVGIISPLLYSLLIARSAKTPA